MTKAIDYTGVKIGMATCLYRSTEKGSNGAMWVLKCDCGNEFISYMSNFKRRGFAACKECFIKRQKERFKNIRKVSFPKLSANKPLSRTKEYKSWQCIKDRCFRTNNPSYQLYGAKGVTMENYLSESFHNFLEEIGPIPEDGKKYSCGRIDNSRGYERGNIRWETDNQQNRNRGMFKNNSSGITGVSYRETEQGRSPRFIARWYNEFGMSIAKSFSVKEYGYEGAKEFAIFVREEAIDRLNRLFNDEGYNTHHGEKIVR